MTDNQKLDFILENMVTRKDLEHMATKADLERMATKEDLMEMESNLLTEIDRVQEKANHHFERVERRLDTLESTVNMIKKEYETVNLLAQQIVQLDYRVGVLEAKIS